MVKENRADAFTRVSTEIKAELDTAIADVLLTPEIVTFIRESTKTIVIEALKLVIRDAILKDVQKAIRDILPSVVAEVVGGGIPQDNLDNIPNVIGAESKREEVESR